MVPPRRDRRGGGVCADVLAAHIVRRAVGAAAAALDRNRVRDPRLRRHRDRPGERGADRDGIDRHRRGAGGRKAAAQAFRHGSSVASRQATPASANARASNRHPDRPVVSAAGGEPVGT